MSLNFRVAARGLARTPGFLVSTVVTLALGMGVATAIFSLVSAILLREAPAHEPDRLVNVHRTAKDGSSFHAFSSLDLRDLRESAGRSFASLAAFSSTVVSLRQAESLQAAELLSVQVTSANYFEALGVAPLLGRTFLPADDTPGTSTVLLSERLWRRRFGASREVLGSAVTLNGLPYTVVGIVPARFTGTFVGFAF
ncbi:MAG: ABC transporter permease, partial [Acidobacteria bacterium]|nr:ABC transporter permease [Acidobacteriota bacterium]